MVLSRNDKRKRKEGDLVDLMEPVSESPKRAKVHAQRKFAQGATTVFNLPPTPIKDKEKAKPAVITELITHKRPNTEDFLTFLCFRGTSLLPPSLNFFNIGSKKEKQTPKISSNGVTGKTTTSSTTPVTEQKSDSSNPKNVNKVKNVVTEKKDASNEMSKNVNKFKTTACTVQALKKKYQEQRLAKQRIKRKFKSSCIIRTRSCSERPVLKSGSTLTSKKFLTKFDSNKRHSLRSSTLLNKSKKETPRTKPVLVKPKKKILIKERNSDTSNQDSMNDEDELSLEKSISQMKQLRTMHKPVQKSICTRSKTEMRRVTRSHSQRTSAKDPSRRPTRKTKEAAAVYMEILGRKLVSPDLDNDDNLSVDSFPELPNARKIAQTENEMKAKIKQSTNKSVGKTKDTRSTAASTGMTRRSDKDVSNKMALKSKRLVKVQKYSETESEEESEKSVETSNARPITRQSLGKLNKPISRSLRSSSKNVATKLESQNNTSTNKMNKNQNLTKSSKDKLALKRKRNQSANNKELPSDKQEDQSNNQKDTKKNNNNNNGDNNTDSDEETLGMILNKLRKKKVCNNDEKLNTTVVTEKIKETNECCTKMCGTKLDLSKISDDEESFRGFTKKAISTVLNSCHTHANANLLVPEEEDGNSYTLKIQSVSRDENSLTIQKHNVSRNSNSSPITTIQEQETASDLPTSVQLQIPMLQKTKESQCNHEKIESKNIVDIPLSALHMRKERVNMSTEQIEKWLNESSLAKEESKLEMENIPSFKYNEPIINTDKLKIDVPHLSIPTKIQHLVRPVNVTLSKLADKSKDHLLIQEKHNSTFPLDPQIIDLKYPNVHSSKIKMENTWKDLIREDNLHKDSSFGVYGKTFKPDLSLIESNLSNSPEKKSQGEKKSIFQGRKGFLPKIKERKVTINSNAFSPENESSVYAFESDTEVPVNTPFRRKIRDCTKSMDVGTISEQKMYETTEENTKNVHLNVLKNQDEIVNPNTISINTSVATTNIVNTITNNTATSSTTTATATATATSTMMELENNEIKTSSANAAASLGINKLELPQNFASLTNVQVLSLDKLTTSWSDVNCSTSIAVQVNFDDCVQKQEQEETTNVTQQKSIEISTQTDNSNLNSDNDGQLFYIPLQAVTRAGPNLIPSQQLIQGVAVKLGTEGPTGPNQRVLLRAKLVTKPPLSIARCPPVGTVQPTTRVTQNSSIENLTQSTSSTGSNTALNIVSNIASNAASYTAPNTTNLIMAPTAVTTSETFSIPSPTKSQDVVVSGTNKQNNTTKLNNNTDKLVKVPKNQRERKLSVDSVKIGKRSQAKSRQKGSDISLLSSSTLSSERMSSSEACLVEAPTFHPSEKDFQDPLEYIDKIRPTVEKFGICRVIPPPNFKPECKVSDDMRFTAYNQYVHRMLHRWGPNVKEMMAIKKYLATQSITLTRPPWIGGMEVDLPHLYQTVQSLGGLKEVIEKKKWQKVADGMKIPKSAQDRVTKLDDIYCKYLLPYDTLSPEERSKLFSEVEAEWIKREYKTLQMQDTSTTDNEDDEDDDTSDEIEECIVKGRNMPLNAFYRIARNTQRMWFGENQRSGNESEGASADEVESAFWKHVTERKRHICVHAASIDSSGRGFGFSVAKNSPFARHPWNLKVLTNNAGSVLRALGPLMGVTVPTLHVGMLFTACCWYRDPHGLPWIEYLHTGAKKIWYGIPDEHNNNFKEALTRMVPQYCKNKTIWLPSDTAMVPPELLVSNGVSLCQTVQEPGQFIIVFPKAFTSSICTGYVVSESVYFAQPSWLETAEQVFKDIQDSCEPSIFSFERLLFNIINDSRSNIDILKQILPSVIQIREREIDHRKKLKSLGLINRQQLPLPDSGKRGKGKKVKEDDGDFECETCRANLFVSLVNNSQDDSVYCLTHALQVLGKNKSILKNCTLMYTYSEDELDDLINKLKDKIEAKSKKTNQIKQSK
ncbi:PREDICTED: protein Jumonji [Polistes dominula]|uniref:Protein Jumonji n=1 Tax=Polistes dominula TaxID=743375 RepID=A0ABM1HVL4_POLDO|nr:PREDICTED: protein Jumonji [Polistes dominula]